MYTQDDMIQVNALLRKRWFTTVVPAAVLLVAAVAVFVAGQIAHSAHLWMLTSALTILGGAYFLFLYGVYVKPVKVYHTHVHYMLNGRMRETVGVFKAFAEESSDHGGLECHAMLVNVGENDNPEDDRLLYFDALKPRPTIATGTRVKVLSNDKMVSDIQMI